MLLNIFTTFFASKFFSLFSSSKTQVCLMVRKIWQSFSGCALFPFLVHPKCFLISLHWEAFSRLFPPESVLNLLDLITLFNMSLLHHWSLIIYWQTCLLSGMKCTLKDKVPALQAYKPNKHIYIQICPRLLNKKNESPARAMSKFKTQIKINNNNNNNKKRGGKAGWAGWGQ